MADTWPLDPPESDLIGLSYDGISPGDGVWGTPALSEMANGLHQL